jgi:hypothetical protein
MMVQHGIERLLLKCSISWRFTGLIVLLFVLFTFSFGDFEMIKTTLSASQLADRLRADDNAGWSYCGAGVLAQYLEDLSEDIGEDIEADIVAIRCDFSECTLSDLLDLHEPDWEAVAREFIDSGDWDPESYLDDLRDHCGTLLEVEHGPDPATGLPRETTYIIQDF